MEPNDVQLKYASSEITTDGGVIPSKLVTADSSSRTQFTWVDSSGTDWSFALGWFDLDTPTRALRGTFFGIRSATSTTVTVTNPLPATPVTGDMFRLAHGLRFKADKAIPFHAVDTFMPEFTTLTMISISGVTIKRGFSAVDVYMRYDANDQMLMLSVDKEFWNAPIDVSSDLTDAYLQTITGEWMVVDVIASDLPSGSVEEQLAFTDLWSTWIPPAWIDSENQNYVLHHYSILENVGNETGNIQTQSVATIGTAKVGSLYTDGDPTITLSDVDGLPGRDFWLYLNESTPDLRYVKQRAGNVCYLADTSLWQEVTFDVGRNDPSNDMNTLCDDTANIAVLRAGYKTGGLWASNNATGLFVVSDSTGLFVNNNRFTVDVATAIVDGDGVYAIRGINRLPSWAVGSDVQWYPPYDVLTVLPGGGNEWNQIDNAMSVIETPSLFPTWTPATGRYTSTTLSSFVPGDLAAVIIRQYLLDDLQGGLQIVDTLSFDWDT